jgi:hypothetical protein
MGCPVQARYDILLREAEKKVDTRLQEIKVPETCNVVKSLSPGRRKTSTKDLARAAAKEAREGAKESVREAAKEAALKETTLEANADDHHRSEASISMPAALEDKQTQPKDLLAAMDSFDNLFCRRCLVFDCRLHGCSQAIVHPVSSTCKFLTLLHFVTFVHIVRMVLFCMQGCKTHFQT